MEKCPYCNTLIESDDKICSGCGYDMSDYVPIKQEQSTSYQNVVHLQKSNLTRCPYCGSTNIQIVKRGWKITSGLIGSGKNERVCANCMKKF